MSDIQLALLIIGILIIIFLVWQLLRYSLKKSKLDRNANPTQASLNFDTDPVLQNSIFDQPPSPVAITHQAAAIDPLIDAIANIKPTPESAPYAILGDAALEAMPSSWRVGSKPFAVEGFNTNTSQWEFPRVKEHYNNLQLSVQLVNRTGPLNAIEFSEFVAKVQAFADVLELNPDFPDMMQEVEKARELDQFAYTHDVQLIFTIQAKQALWSPDYVRKTAASLGFIPSAVHGRLLLPDPNNMSTSILTLSFGASADLQDDPLQEAIDHICLQLDVAHVAKELKPYEQLCEKAKELALTMNGYLRDDEGNAIIQEALNQISNDLEGIYHELDMRDLSAGSPQARRLFS